MKFLSVTYEGRVQGVGFRASVKAIARGYEVRGSIQNLPDGRVELKTGGESEEVDGFLEAIRESHLAGHIRQELAHPIGTEQVVARGFEIVG